MEIIELPKYVYKYISWEKNYHKKILNANEVYFTSASKFNDPFDSSVPLRYELGRDEQIFDLCVAHVRRDDPMLTDDEVKRVARNILRDNDPRSPEWIKYHIKVQREYATTKFGILSFSTINNSILMWSHYSNYHQGICVRFNCQKFREFIESKECWRNDLIIYWNYVAYKKEYPLQNPFELDWDESYVKQLLIKSDNWEYEKELRFILFRYPNMAVIIPNGIIDQVILGCKISESNKMEIIEIAKSKKIELLQADLKQDAFGLDFNNINV
jgi:Protein of unknown function (DUF2971)